MRPKSDWQLEARYRGHQAIDTEKVLVAQCGRRAQAHLGWAYGGRQYNALLEDELARTYQGNNRKRRIAKRSDFSAEQLARIAEQAQYGGSALHKSKPADYGLDPPVNPRPTKSLCDGLRVILASEARELLLAGIHRGIVSTWLVGGLPKYVWAQDAQGEVYEAKLGGDMRSYHGYRLGDDEEAMKKCVTDEWAKRQA